jgi:hypothetical protein
VRKRIHWLLKLVLSKVVYSDIGYLILTFLYELLKYGGEAPTWQTELDNLNAKFETSFFHASLSPWLFSSVIPYYPYETPPPSLDPAEASLPSLDPVEASLPSGEDKDVLPPSSEGKDIPLHSNDHPFSFGPIHDLNGAILSSFPDLNKNIVSGHAGLWGSLEDVKKMIPYLRQTQIQGMKELGYENSSNEYVLGLRRKEYEGRTFYGHYGFTGVHFWFDLKEAYQIFLTNRTSARSSTSPKTSRVLSIKSVSLQKSFLFLIDKDGTFKEVEGGELIKLINEAHLNTTRTWDKKYTQPIFPFKELDSLREQLLKFTFPK